MALKHIYYEPSKSALRVLIKGNILAPGESPQEMFERAMNTIFNVESTLGITKHETEKAKEEFASCMAQKMFTPGTPTLTNAGRPGYENSALSSCAIIPVNLRKKQAAKKLIKAYYRQNMGSGFDLTPYENPVELLLWLNDMAVKETKTGEYDRYIGNLANLHISHPKIHDFIKVKTERALPHFNCSVVIDDEFLDCAIKNKDYYLMNNSKIKARGLLLSIAKSAWQIGDPSLINLQRMNAHNPIEKITPYISAPPCAEMGLSEGETCQFIYVNISKFCTPSGINYALLEKVIKVVVRGLDNAVEYGISRYPHKQSSFIAKLKRKIGIAVSGIADTLLYYQLPYSSNGSLKLVRDVVSFINYISKLASVDLAKTRGSCEAMKNKKDNKYYHGYLKNRYNFSTRTVSSSDWKKLDEKIAESGLLRNIHTITQPPAARVSYLMDCSFGIEPIFGYPDSAEKFSKPVLDFLRQVAPSQIDKIINRVCETGTFQKTPLSKHAKKCLRTAIEISPTDHIKMVAALAGKKSVVDETVSKTVNLSRKATVMDVYNTIVLAHKSGLKNISVYRDGSYENQPYKLSK